MHLSMLRRSASIEGFPAVVRTGTSASFFDRLDAYRRGAAGALRRALPRKAPGHLHHPGPDQVLEPAARASAARRVPRGAGRARRTPLAARAAGLGVEGRAAAPVPRHHPGSSIERVNVEAEARYAALDAALRAEQEALFGASGDEVFVNTTTVRRQGHVRGVDGRASYDAALFETVALAPWSGTAPTASAKVLENDLLRATFDDAGAVASLIDKTTGRESLAAASITW